jgi:hypothetical protein
MNHRWHWMPHTEEKTMKRIRHTLCLLMLSAIATLALAASATAQTVVVGTGNPDIDVPAVQAAVDQGGEVLLKGHFSFNRAPTVPTAPELAVFTGGLATVLVGKSVVIYGRQDGDEEMASIEGGTTPFYVDAPGAGVTIQELRFIRPTADAILVNAVSGLLIASCKIEGLEFPARPGTNSGIDLITSPGLPTPTIPGKPEKISGTLLIVNNDINVAGGTAQDIAMGISIFSVGVPGAEVEAYLLGNKIRNVTEPAINIRRAVGRVYVERNVITTGSIASTAAPAPEVIRIANLGTYLIAHNRIDCGWADANAKGIGVFSQFGAWPLEGAVIVDNDVTMSPPPGTVFGDSSAAIDVRGFAQDSVVLNNRIGGRARAALSVDVLKGGIPANTAFVLNRVDDFEASVADVAVGLGALNTRIVGAGTVQDFGTGTTIVRLPRPGERDGDHKDRDH